MELLGGISESVDMQERLLAKMQRSPEEHLQDLTSYRDYLMEQGLKPMGWHEFNKTHPPEAPDQMIQGKHLLKMIGSYTALGTVGFFGDAKIGYLKDSVLKPLHMAAIGGGIMALLGAVQGIMTMPRLPAREQQIEKYENYLKETELNGFAASVEERSFAQKSQEQQPSDIKR